MDEAGWERFEGQDVQCEEPPGRPLPAASAEQLAVCRAECLRLGYGGFVAKRGAAIFRPHGRDEILEQKASNLWGRGATLHVAPPAREPGGKGGMMVVHGESVCHASLETLSASSGYFAALLRNSWADGGDCHSFGEFPGGEEAFAFAMAWLATDAGVAVGEPWPVRNHEQVCGVVLAAAYLDSPGLLCAAARSWRLASTRPWDQLMRVAETIVEASLQFSDTDQDSVLSELRAILQELPKHCLALAPAFLAAPSAGLAVLDVRHAARESLYGHIRNVGSWVGSVISSGSGERAGQVAETDMHLSPHEFAVRLFDAHELAFRARKRDLRQLLSYVDPATPIEPPLCFRIAAAAASAETINEEEVFAGQRLAVDIFERSIGSAPDPSQAASDSSCVVGLFGAGGSTTDEAPLSLEVLARPLVPPSAATVVLSRVLSSWAIAESREGGADGADVILAGVASDRQHLRTMLEAVLPRIAGENGTGMCTEWGSSFDYAVPELRAAFICAAQRAATAVAPRVERVADDTLRLLFRILYQPSGGLPGIRFPLGLLAEVKDHNPACVALVAHRALEELRAAAAQASGHAWELAESLWPIVSWESADQCLVENAVEMLKSWLVVAKAETTSGRKRAWKEIAVRLLRQLPLQHIQDPEEMLGPPIPAHVLACLARREQERCLSKISALELENEALRQEVARLSMERHKSN